MVSLPPRSEFLKITSDNHSTHILIIGESTAAGVGATSSERTFAAQIFEHTKGKFNIYNLGKNGLRTGNLFDLFKKSEIEVSQSFSKAIILIGANDCFKFTPPWKFRKEIESFILFLKDKKGVEKIIIPMIPPVQEFPLIPGIRRFFLGWHRDLLSKEPQLLEKKISNLSFENQETETSEAFYSEDGIHPSDFGYELIASHIALKI